MTVRFDVLERCRGKAIDEWPGRTSKRVAGPEIGLASLPGTTARRVAAGLADQVGLLAG